MQLRVRITLESVDMMGRGFDDPIRVTQEYRCQKDTRMERIEYRGASGDAQHQEAISAMVGGLIAKRGYYSVIDELVAAVYNLGEMSLADPDNSEKMRDFDMWAYAVRAAIVKHDGENTFENRLTEWDRMLAKKMGISLA